jgi:hypothetical protein
MMRPAAVVFGVVALLAAAIEVRGQALDYTGTWRLNREASRITPGVGLAYLGAGGAPPTLYVTQAANGSVVVGSDINESQARLYRVEPGKPLAGDRDGATDQFTISADGRTLTVNVSASNGTSTLVYAKTHDVDPCEKWPTPCRW